MKKFKTSFSLALVVFLAFYLFAIVKGAENPYAKIFSKNERNDVAENNIENTKNTENTENTSENNTEEDNKAEQMIDDEFFFLLFGTDSHNIDESKGHRSDTMILTKVNFKTGEVRMINLPRDTRVPVAGHGLTKLNHAHSYGGTQLLMQTIRKAFNINLDYFVKVDYTLVKNIVDAIGGVKFNVPFNMNYYDPTDKPPLKINIKAGEQVLDGDNAVKFLRYRGNQGDVDRIPRQQAFIKAFMEQALSLKNIGKLPKIFTELKSNIRTNFGEKQVLEAIVSLPKLDLNNISMGMIPGNAPTINGQSYWVYDKNATQKLFEENFGEYLNAK